MIDEGGACPACWWSGAWDPRHVDSSSSFAHVSFVVSVAGSGRGTSSNSQQQRLLEFFGWEISEEEELMAWIVRPAV